MTDKVQRQARTYTSEPSLARPIDEHDHIAGAETAPVTLLVYGDYQCEFTRAAYGPISEVRRQMGERMRFVFRHFPLRAVHEHAQMAAEIAEAAAAQGRFWEMHSFLFEGQSEFDMDEIMEFAEEIGLDLDRLEREVNEHVYSERVHEDVKSGIDSGVGETPTLFINGIRYTGPTREEALLASVRAAAEEG